MREISEYPPPPPGTPSNKTFWIHSCKDAKLFFVALDKPHGFIFVCVMVNHTYHIWASTQESLSSGVCKQQKLSLISAFVIRLLETRNIHFFLLTTIVIVSPGLHIYYEVVE